MIYEAIKISKLHCESLHPLVYTPPDSQEHPARYDVFMLSPICIALDSKVTWSDVFLHGLMCFARDTLTAC